MVDSAIKRVDADLLDSAAKTVEVVNSRKIQNSCRRCGKQAPRKKWGVENTFHQNLPDKPVGRPKKNSQFVLLISSFQKKFWYHCLMNFLKLLGETFSELRCAVAPGSRTFCCLPLDQICAEFDFIWFGSFRLNWIPLFSVRNWSFFKVIVSFFTKLKKTRRKGWNISKNCSKSWGKLFTSSPYPSK